MADSGVIVGRARERTRLVGLLDGARAGRSGSLVLVGEPGMGKSVLLNEAVVLADGFTVLRAVGVPPGGGRPFAALEALLRPCMGLLEGLPGPQAEALRAALGRGGNSQPDRFAAYAGAFGVLGAAAVERPVLVVVDDAHWIDSASAEALLFAARRVDAEGVALLFAVHDGDDRGTFRVGLPTLTLGGLDVGDTAAMLGDRRVSAHVLRQLVAGTGGNPLALREVTAALSDDQRSGVASLPQPLPAAGILARALAQRIGALPPAARRAILVAAAGEDGLLTQVVPALTTLGLGVADLEPAEAAGLVVFRDGRVDFTNPLARSAAYHAADDRGKREAHRALARTLPAGDLVRRAWHLARTVSGPDEEVACELQRAARHMGARTAYLAAAEVGMRAVALSEDTRAGVDRALEAAGNAYLGGDMPRALAMTDALTARDLPGATGAALHRLRGRIRFQEGPLAAAAEEFVRAADLLAPDDPAEAALALVAASRAAADGDHIAMATRHARRALQLAPTGRADVRRLATAALLSCRLASGDPTWRELAGGWAPADLPPEYLSMGVLLLVWLGEPERAGRAVAEALEPAGRAGAARSATLPLADRALLRYLEGFWDGALADAHETVRLASLTGQRAQRVPALALMARIAAARGREQECREYTHEVLELGDALGMRLATAFAHAALGLLELGRGEPDVAVTHLERTAGQLRELGLANPSIVCYQGDLVEALARSGDRERATREVMRLLGEAGRVGSGVGHVLADGGWALVVADEGVGDVADALSGRGHHPLSFPHARTALCVGERLVGLGRLADARAPLEAALATFVRLDAAPWVARATTLLAAAGVRAHGAPAALGTPLTPKELQVALAVAEGLSNKEVAARLFLSTKTVEFHLSRAYRKVGVSSRAGLARLAAEGRLGRGGEAHPG